MFLLNDLFMLLINALTIMITAILPIRANAVLSSPRKMEISLVIIFCESGENFPPTISSTMLLKLKSPSTFSIFWAELWDMMGFI